MSVWSPVIMRWRRVRVLVFMYCLAVAFLYYIFSGGSGSNPQWEATGDRDPSVGSKGQPQRSQSQSSKYLKKHPERSHSNRYVQEHLNDTPGQLSVFKVTHEGSSEGQESLTRHRVSIQRSKSEEENGEQQYTMVTDDQDVDCRYLPFGVNASFPICLYAPALNDVISKVVAQEHNAFESVDLRLLSFYLSSSDQHDLGFIDLGANIGMYSIAVTQLGYPVLAVEPVYESARRLVKAASMLKRSDKLTLLLNAVSNKRGQVRMAVDKYNRGRANLQSERDCTRQDTDIICIEPVTTILMDDLLQFVNFKRAIMKLDIEGHEIIAFKKSDQFFKSIEVPVIFMEWEWYTTSYQWSEEGRQEVDEFIALLTRRGYQPYHQSGIQLPLPWYGWPKNVYWLKTNSFAYGRI